MGRDVGFVPPPPPRGGKRAVDYAIRGGSSSSRGRLGPRSGPSRPRSGDQGPGGSVHPRHVLLKKRVLPIEDYAEELNGPAISKAQCMRLYGVSLAPIPLPLDPGETEAQHERRFLIWLGRRNMDIADLRLNANMERAQWIKFAKIKTKMYVQRMAERRGGKRSREEYQYEEGDDDFEDDDGDDDVEEEDSEEEEEEEEEFKREVESVEDDGEERVVKRPRVTTSSSEENVLLRRRVLTADEYRAEIERERDGKLTQHDRARMRSNGTVLIPVPLLPGETEDQYERRFLKYLMQSGHTLADLAGNPGKERSIRMNFARLRIGATGRRTSHPLLPNPVKPARPERQEPLPRATSVIAKPYEAVEVKPASKSHSQQSVSPSEPTNVVEAWQFPRACTLLRPSRDSPTQVKLQAYLSCGCRLCLLYCTGRLVTKVAELETEVAAITATATESKKVMDLTHDAEMSSTSSVASLSSANVRTADVPKMLHIMSLIKSRRLQPSSSLGNSEDPIEQQLLSQYDEINDRVITNQRVLDHSAAQLQGTPVDRVREAAPSQDENLELQGLIEEEMDNRNAALAMLLVYMWRQAPQDLEQRVQASAAANVPHVQRICHQKCASIASELASKKELASELTSQLDAVLNEPPPPEYDPDSDLQRLTRLQELGAELTHVESDVRVLVASRRRELTTLLHFDAHVRELISALMQEETS